MKRQVVTKLFGACVFYAASAVGLQSFTIEDIKVEGLQRISAGTVFNYLPVKVGEQFDQKLSADSIKALFRTGFFKDVRLEQEGNNLVVIVEERPSIASVKIEGNKDIGTDDLKKALKGVGLSEGKVFDRAILDKVEQELRRQYYSRGKYGLKIDSTVSELPRNRVDVEIRISEGKAAKISQINIVGNNAFSDGDLLDEFELSTPDILSWYTKNDQYSKQKLQADLERLRSHYLDRGYVNFQIESTQVSITPDKKEIYINVNVKEGDVYKVNDVKVTGKLIVPEADITPLVKIGPQDTFSRKLATETSKAISDKLGDEGYIFSNVNMVPEINEAQKTVAMTFFVDPGKQVYVRRIGFKGNTKTRDEVLRREMRQMESAWASNSKIERSKTRLERLGYFQEVNVETPPVPGTSDQIDVNYTVAEKPSGNIMAGVGFSQLQGIIFNANITQDNVFGTGKKVTFNFNNSQIYTVYQFGLFNPYLTLDGVSGGFDIAYRKTDAFRVNLANYSTDSFVVGGNIGVPLGEFDSLRFNLDFNHTKVQSSANSSQEVIEFLNPDPGNIQAPLLGQVPNYLLSQNISQTYNYFPLAIGWVHDTLNRAIFPSNGGAHRVSVMGTIPLPGDQTLEFYKASYKLQYYFSIAKDLVLFFQGEVAYGDGFGNTDTLPFFENYFAGGPQSIRGFFPSSLGPRTTPNAQGLGGNLSLGGASKLAGTLELQFPVPFLSESKNIRLGAFVDAGNVYCNFFEVPGPGKTPDYPYDTNCYAPAKGDFIRYSAGLSARWLSPFGNLAFSVAEPLNTVTGDRTQSFQFTFGQGF